MKIPKSLEWKQDALHLLDQTLLPFELKTLVIKDVDTLWEAIKSLRVRGAPAISIAGSYGLYLGMKDSTHLSKQNLKNKTKSVSQYLNSSRPTAVNLQNALQNILNAVENSIKDSKDLLNLILNTAHEIYLEDVKICTALGENALSL
jgi:methylthioribose-1-phosphate isomerase